MQKTKAGISVGLFAAAIYFIGLFGDYMPVLVLVGYVLLCEENEWLKKSAVKAISLKISISFLFTIVYLIPNAINIIDDVASIVGGSFQLTSISELVSTVSNVLNIAEALLFIGLGVKALTQRTITIPVVDKVLNKYMR